MSQITYFITGANGFIGSALAAELSRRGENSVLLFHRSDDHPLLKGVSGLRVRGDILRPETYREHLTPTTRVIHAAGRVSFSSADREEVERVNREGTRRLAESCLDRGVESLVFLSAGAVWGSTGSAGETIAEESPPAAKTADAYAQSKIAGERICRESAEKGLRAVIVNPATVYGAGDYRLRAGGRVTAEILRRGGGWAPPGGTSWLDIADAVRGILLAGERGGGGENYILCSGNIFYRDLFSLISVLGGQGSKVKTIPLIFRFPLTAAARAAEIGSRLLGRNSPVSSFQIAESFRFKYFRSEKARRELGFSPQTPLDESLRATADFNRGHGLK
ncbi:MAG: NAD-dependent epimerase/dehydratase family protein [Candidatus Erginobacter occultus]|nr:NAD-dependent epimerase/dehydratase family protein [Candidatus Erginobacter occultus]